MIKQLNISQYPTHDHPKQGGYVYVEGESEPYEILSSYPKGKNMLIKKDGKSKRVSKIKLYLSPCLPNTRPYGLKLRHDTHNHEAGKVFPFEETNNGQLFVTLSTIKGMHLVWAHLGIDGRKWEVVY